MGLLSRVDVPTDIRRLSMDELTTLAAEIRDRIVQSVSKNGGHLASNLGVTELTIALHYVYNLGPFPRAGSAALGCRTSVLSAQNAHRPGGRCSQPCEKGGPSADSLPAESPYDLFAVGHAGTAISTAVGMARAGRC